ncbi:MAG TPA: hypothetical protein VMU17_02955 [Elusimicrobiota bacterium]|nr:hypothetical protein [Elusimicrobiota bacterium]
MRWMKQTVFTALVTASIAPSAAQAITSRVGAAQDLGVGVELGQPMGFTGKYWLSSTTAVDAFMGYHYNHNFDAHADYLWHSFSSFDVSRGRLPFYLGLGGRINLGDDSHFGMRLPIGVSYLFPTQPLEAFVEIAPVVKLITDIGLDVDGSVGLRVYLNYLK